MNFFFYLILLRYEKVLNIDPENFKALEKKGYALSELEKYSEALVW